MPDTPPPPRQKWALLVGIDRYPNLSSFAQLEGCVNDARLMASVLTETYGFPEAHVTVLTDEAATRDGILAAMEALAERAGPDDVVVMHYAGHGSQMTDREGDEPDGMDETIVPHDAGRAPLPNRDITDDEIHDWLVRVTAKTPYVTLLFDCCHSGTIARDAFGLKARSVPPDTRPASELPPSPTQGIRTRSATAQEGPSGWLPLSRRYVLVAGCRDDEQSYEYRDPDSGTAHGALTYFLSRQLVQAAPGTTYRDVFEAVSPSVTAHSQKQHPQMEGALDRELFGIRDITPMHFAAVSARTGPAVTLAAGAAHGLTPGSVWAVYPPGTKQAEGTDALGRVRVTRVGAVTSEADVVEEASDGAISVGARAIEADHAYGEMTLRVAFTPPGVDPDAEAAFAEAVEASSLLSRADADGADVRAYLLGARINVPEGAPVPQLGPLGEATWAVVGTDGRLVMPAHAAREPGVGALLRDNLEKIARYRHALALDNADPSSVLRGRIDVEVLRQRPNDAWIVAAPEEAGGEIVFEEGERLALRVTNRHDAPVFVHALDFGLTGRISLFTIAGASDALAPGGTQEVGIRRPLVLGFPKDFPFVREPGDAGPDEGLETIKVFATTQPTDFSALLQEGVRSVETEPRSPLARLLARSFHGATRDLSFGDAPEADAEDWTTVTRAFVLRRRTTGVALDAAGATVQVGAVRLRTPGLGGQAQVMPAFSARTRSVDATTDAFEAVLEAQDVQPQHTVRLAGVQAVASRAAEAEPILEVEVPAPAPGAGQMVLYTDAEGVTTWQFARPEEATRALDGPSTRTYVISRGADEAAPEVGTRGLIGAVGEHLIKTLVFPLLDPVLGAVGDYFAGRWEAKNRPYRVRPFTPADYTLADVPPLDADAWRRLSAGRALLFVHGTFSRAHSAFGGLAPEALQALHAQYGGRVFAFDHFTLSHDPRENVAHLLHAVPDEARLDVDIVCHSRGGLVSRVLAEQQSGFSLGSKKLDVGKIVFVASPNAGTALADRDHMGDLLDTFTNVLNFIPDNPVTDVLEGVVTVAKQLAVGAMGGLDGLMAMTPGGPFQQTLNAAGGNGAHYFALGARYTPTDPGLRSFVTSRLIKKVFGADNDLVVPTESVYAANGSGRFPIEARHVFEAPDGVSHTSFFQHPAAQQKLLEWLHA